MSNGNSKPCPRTALSTSSSVRILPVVVKGGPKKEDNHGEEEGEAYGAGSDVVKTPLRVEEKTSTAPVWEREGEARMRCSLGKGEMQKRGETRQAK